MPTPPATTPASSAIHEQLERRITEGKLDLPVLPEVASEVVKLCNDPNAEVRKLASVVQRDQAMAGHLMRLANSPFYAPKFPLVSLDQVVGRMGMKKVREIALMISCQSKVFAVPGHEATVKHLFRHSLAAGAFAQEIARSRRWNVEEAFLCGLLHDVGRPVLLQELVDLYTTAKIPFDGSASTALIDARHAAVGAALVDGWSLPARLGETIRTHHHPLTSTTAAQTAMMTNLADDLAHLLLEGGRQVSEASLREHPMLTPLNLYPEEMDALLAKRPAVKAMVESIA